MRRAHNRCITHVNRKIGWHRTRTQIVCSRCRRRRRWLMLAADPIAGAAAAGLHVPRHITLSHTHTHTVILVRCYAVSAANRHRAHTNTHTTMKGMQLNCSRRIGMSSNRMDLDTYYTCNIHAYEVIRARARP